MARLRTGLRLRIAATIAGIVVLAVGGLGVAVHYLLVLERVDQARADADRQVLTAAQIYRRTGLLSFDATLDDPAVPAELRAAVRRPGARSTLVEGSGTRTVWAATRTGTRVLSTRTSLRPVDGTVRVVDRTLLLAGAAVVLLALLLGVLSANRLARRLRVAARTAREVAGGRDPRSLRAAVGRRRDEVGDLADAVDAMAERLNVRLVREQQFTADVAQDLRTPVTGLVAAAALLEDSRPAQLVRDRVAMLSTLVEDLLEVSRLDRGAEQATLEQVDLAESVTRAVRRGVAVGEYAESDVVVRADPGAVLVMTDPRRLERVLSNLVRNGLQHGRGPVEVTQEGHEVRVRDHGRGFDHDVLADGPHRFRRADRRGQGNGLGLVIAAGQAEVLGATLSFANARSGGALVRLVVPEDLGAGDATTSAAEAHGHVTAESRRRDRTGRSR